MRMYDKVAHIGLCNDIKLLIGYESVLAKADIGESTSDIYTNLHLFNPFFV